MFALLILEVMVAVLLILVTSSFAYWIYLKNSNYWSDKSIPFDCPHPFLGLITLLIKGKALHEIDQELHKKHGKIFGTYSILTPYLNVSDPDLIKLVLVKDFDVFPNRRKFEFGIELVDNMLGVIDGDERWRNIRQTMTPAFSSGKLKAMIPGISECATASTKNFMKVAREGKALDCKNLLSSFTLDVIASIAFGTKLDSYNDPNNEFIVHARKFSNLGLSLKVLISFLFPKLAKALGMSLFPKESFEFFKDATNSIIKRRTDNNEVRPDFLQLMMESRKINEQFTTTINENNKTNIESVEQIKRKPLTEVEALAQCVGFFIAGLENIAGLINLICYFMAVDPEVQNKVIEEVDRIWEKRTTLDGEALYETKYIDAVIDETLRLFPPQIKIERRAEKDCLLGDTGIPLKKGMYVGIPVYAIHHDPEFFPEPEKFKPERFMSKEDNEVQQYTYLPFGAGPRNCVAMRFALMEVKMFLLHILRSIKFTTCSETKIPLELVKNSAQLLPKEIILKVVLRS